MSKIIIKGFFVGTITILILLIASCSKPNQQTIYQQGNQTIGPPTLFQILKEQPDNKTVESILNTLKQKFENIDIIYNNFSGSVVEYCENGCPNNKWVKKTYVNFVLTLPPKSAGGKARIIYIDASIDNTTNELQYSPSENDVKEYLAGIGNRCIYDEECKEGQVCGDIYPVRRIGGLSTCKPTPECENQPGGCPICLSKGSMIGTPKGLVTVEQIEIGSLIWTQDKNGNKILVYVKKVAKTKVPENFLIVHLRLQDGRELFVSPNHPTADGRLIGELKVGDNLDNSVIALIEKVPYEKDFTYDILPSGDTGLYWVNGILLKSTLKS